MEFRELQYFLTVVREGTISGAAHALHVAQPSLSRQMRELEEQLGKTLFVRGNRKIALTEEGMILEKRAEEIVRLMQMTEHEIENAGDELAGDVYIGAAETNAVHFLTRAAASVQREHPNVCFHISSGDTTDTMFQLEHGLIDFALLFSTEGSEKYHAIRLPISDRMVALMKRDHPLSRKETVSLQADLCHEPLIISRLAKDAVPRMSGERALNIAGTYNLAYNASIMVEDGMGIAICFDGIVDTGDGSALRAVPITDVAAGIHPTVIWRKYQMMSRPAAAFAEKLSGMVQ